MNHTLDAIHELQHNFGLLPAGALEELIQQRDRRSLTVRFCAWICGK